MPSCTLRGTMLTGKLFHSRTSLLFFNVVVAVAVAGCWLLVVVAVAVVTVVRLYNWMGLIVCELRFV